MKQVREWFDELWEDSETYDLAALYRARFAPHNPYLIYLRMLYERYGAEVEDQARQEGTGLRLTTFQQDGVWRAKRILDAYHGVLVADGVGLGKSFIAGELIREAVVERRQRVLLITPATLRDGPWRKFLADHQLGVESVSYEELTADPHLNPGANGTGLRYQPNDYALVVIDEAHAYRNPETQRAGVLRRLLAGSPPKQLVLLTATPVNNSLWDLFYLLGYFITNDGEFAASGIPSLKTHFAEAMATDPEDLSPDKLFDVLDGVAVRRTRHFVKKYYPHDMVTIGGVEVPITFPKPEPITVTYDLDAVLPGFFVRFAHALDCVDLGECEHGLAPGAPTLHLARYTPSLYRTAGRVADGDGEQVQREVNLAGLLRSGLLKRFESSAAAFAQTCRRMAQSHDGFVAFLDVGLVPEPEALTEWLHRRVGRRVPHRRGVCREAGRGCADRRLRCGCAPRCRHERPRSPAHVRGRGRIGRSSPRSEVAPARGRAREDRQRGRGRGVWSRRRARQAEGAGLQLLRRHGRLGQRVPR